MNQAQIERVYSTLPEQWIGQEEFEAHLRRVLGIPDHDGATVGLAVEALRVTHAARSRWVGRDGEAKRLEWTRGHLPERVDPGQAFLDAENARLARERDERRVQEKAQQAREEALNATPRALERARMNALIDSRLVEHGVITQEQAEAAREACPAVGDARRRPHLRQRR